jgi:HAD superfamily hydrolase (TIGR01549 family)
MEKSQQSTVRGVVLDVDGTLIDSNKAHAHAWVQAMHEYGYEVPFEKVAPLIGMGGDKVLPETLHIEKNSEMGQRISKRRQAIFKEQYLPHLRAFPRTLDLLRRMREQGLKLVIATSAEPDELQGLLHVIDQHVKDLFENETTAKEASHSKPDADIMRAAIERIQLPPQALLMLGDTAYDIESAAKVQIKTVALRSGGWSDQDLKGAIAIYNDPADLLEHFDNSPFVRGY